MSIRDAESGIVLFEYQAAEVSKAASIGKLALLGYVGAEILADPQLADEPLDRESVEPVGDSGLWQHLSIKALSIADAAKLVFAASDNWATNALLRRFGLEEVNAFRSRLGLIETVLYDQVRDERGPQHPAVLSRSSAAELSGFMARLWRGEVLDDSAFCRWFIDGLSLSLDLSMVASAVGLDPLAHAGPDARLGIANKTGTDVGVRGDAGVLSAGGRRYAYACLANYRGGVESDREVIGTMREVGRAMIRGDFEAMPWR